MIGPLAIVARQAEVVQLILKHLQIRCFSANNNNPEKNLKRKLLELLSETTKVKFTNGTKDDYDRNDCTLDGINSVHLAARFHAKSLLVIMRFLKDLDLLSYIKGPIIYFIEGRSPSRHKQSFFI